MSTKQSAIQPPKQHAVQQQVEVPIPLAAEPVAVIDGGINNGQQLGMPPPVPKIVEPEPKLPTVNEIMAKLKANTVRTAAAGVNNFTMAATYAYGFSIVALTALITISVLITSEGLRRMGEFLATPLSALPFLEFLDEYEYQADYATIGSILICLLSWTIWKSVIKDLFHAAGLEVPAYWKSDRLKMMLRVIAFFVLAADGFLFYAGILESQGWSSEGMDVIKSGALTGLYISAIVWLAYKSVELHLNSQQKE